MSDKPWSIHIVHPYTYKFDGKTNVIGQIARFSVRDTKIKAILENSLGIEVPLICHWNKPQGTLEGALCTTGLFMDPNFESLFDDRVINLTTTPYGIPLDDERPKNIPLDRWDVITRYYDTVSSMKKKLPQTERVLFLGGVYENCLVNCVSHFNDNFMAPNQILYVCPDLSVSIVPEEYSRCRNILLSKGVQEITADEAIPSVSRERIVA